MATHSFPVIIEVEDSALGPVMKLLHKTPGVIKFHVDMDAVGGKKKPHGNNGKTKKKNCVDPVLLGIKRGHVTREQIATLYVAAGGRASGVNPFLQRGKQLKWLTPVGDKFKLGPEGEKRLKKMGGRNAD